MYQQLFQQRLFAAIDTRPSAKAVFNKIQPMLLMKSSPDNDIDNDDSFYLERFAQITSEFNQGVSMSSSSSSSGSSSGFQSLDINRAINNNNNSDFISVLNDSRKSEFVKEFANLYFAATTTNSTRSSSSSSCSRLPSLSDMLLLKTSSSTSSTDSATVDHLHLFSKHSNMLIDCFERMQSSSSVEHQEQQQQQQLSILSSFADFLRISTIAISDPWIRALCWARTLQDRMQSKVEELCDPFDHSEQYQTLIEWKQRVVEPFVRTLLIGGGGGMTTNNLQRNSSASSTTTTTNSDQVDQWMTFCTEYICRAVAKIRLDSIFDDIVDYPDSRPHLSDIASCVAQQPSLLHDVARVTKAAITNRLQHAGASTANVLFLLSQTCRALCTIRPGKAAGEALIRQVCDTTIRHLRARKDSVIAVVAAITTTSTSSSSHSWARVGGGGAEPNTKSSSSSSSTTDPPDILKMLLSVLTVPVIVQEYCRTLSERLLTKKPQQIDMDGEKEILERLKVLLGEDALSSNAAVMLKDFETSKRWMRSVVVAANNKNNTNNSSSSSTTLQLHNASANVVSAPCWPETVGEGSVPCEDGGGEDNDNNNNDNEKKNDQKNFRLHPSLQEYHKRISQEFHKWKQNQSLRLLPHLGFVDLSVTQKVHNNNNNNNDTAAATNQEDQAQQIVRKTFRLNLLAASVVLYLSSSSSSSSSSGSSSSSSSCPLKEMAETKLNIPVPVLVQHIQNYVPQLFVIKSSNKKTATEHELVIELQQYALSSRDLMDHGDASSDQKNDDNQNNNNSSSSSSLLSSAVSGPTLPSGVTQQTADRLEQMLRTMIPNTGPKSATQIENSARMFGIFSGNSDTMRELLSYFLQKNVISTDGSGIYKLA